MVRLLETYGFDIILVETAGAGQGDTAVRSLADTVVLLLQAETGDDLQWEKAGVLEVADIIVIHKADLPGSEHVEAQVKAALQLGSGQSATLVRVSAKTGEGVERLWQLINDFHGQRSNGPPAGSELLRLAQESLAVRFASAAAAGDPRLQQLIRSWQERRVNEGDAASTLLQLLGEK